MRIAFTVLLCATAASCAPAAPPAGPAGLSRFDGVFRGTVVANGGGVECGAGSSAIRITVRSGHAWAGPRRRRHRMDGRVTEDGQIALTDDTGSHQLRGSISGDRLTGVEDMPRSASLARQEPGTSTVCPAVVTAMRGGAAAGPAED